MEVMPRLSLEARRRIVSLYSGGFSVKSIVQRLDQENVSVSQRAVYNLVKKFRFAGVIKDLLIQCTSNVHARTTVQTGRC